jgi:hypothetical protein
MSRGAIGVKSRWARLRDDINVKLRRGAWYRVLDESDLEAVIDVGGRPKTILKAMIEIVSRPYPKWTVVRAKAGGRASLGDPYGVCPSCGERAKLGRAKRLTCPSCKWEFEIAWDEGYLT